MNERDSYGRTLLHYAAADADISQVIELLECGHDPNLADLQSWVPLHFAAQANDEAVTRALLDAGAAVDLADANGNTPLWRAVFSSRGNGDVIGLLLARGADPYIENCAGVSSASLAQSISNYDVSQYFSGTLRGDPPAA